jgi:hypothetical protein
MHYFSALPLNIPYNILMHPCKKALRPSVKVGSSFAYILMTMENS